MKIEIGGGSKPKGEGFINVDRCDTADVKIDMESDPLPFPDASVDEVYSSHCLEHVRNLRHLVAEIVRVCKPGATVEIRVPHWGSEMANCFEHVQTISEQQAGHFSECKEFWCKNYGSLKLLSTEYVPNGYHAEAIRLFPHLSGDQVFRFLQNTCHEIIFRFVIEKP